MISISISTEDLVAAAEYLDEVARIDPRKPAVEKLSEVVHAELETRAFKSLPPDHPARVDPDYPPNDWQKDL